LPTNARAKAAQSLDGLDDVETLRAEFERLVAERETTAAKAVKEMEAAVPNFCSLARLLALHIAIPFFFVQPIFLYF
jgi:hypothetical protein